MRLNRRGLRVSSSKSRAVGTMLLLGVAGFAALRLDSSAWKGSSTSAVQTAAPHGTSLRSAASAPLAQFKPNFGKLPLSFEANQGQADTRVKFSARGVGYDLFLTSDEAVLSLRHAVKKGAEARSTVVRMAVAGARAGAEISAADELPSKSNYIIGNDPTKWHRNVPQFARVRYHQLYPGIDLVYYGNQNRLEYDFEVSPGGDPKQIALDFRGGDRLRLSSDGDLVLTTAGEHLTLQSPKIYQRYGNEQRAVAGRFALRGKNRVGFDLGTYDRTRALIIDPVLEYSSYIGGTGNEACSLITGGAVTAGCPSLAIDVGNNIYVAGTTTSADFPVLNGLANPGGSANLFVIQFNGSGIEQYATYFGGNGTDLLGGLAVDGQSPPNIYLAGSTTSSNFPTNGGFQAAAVSTGRHAFVTKLSPVTNTPLYSTYLSGTGTDVATGLALSSSGQIYVTGTTSSTTACASGIPVAGAFPTTTGSFQPCAGATNQFFFSQLDPAQVGLPSLLYSTFIGGTNPTSGTVTGGGIAVDTNGNAYITGATNFTDMPVLNAFQGTLAGGTDAWVAKFNPSAASPGGQEIYLTYLGGAGNDAGFAVDVDGSGSAYVTGSTAGGVAVPSGLPTAFQGTYGGGASDAFVAKLGGTLCTSTSSNCATPSYPLNYFSYIGGSGADVGLAIKSDTGQGAHVAGWTNSGNLPVTSGGGSLAGGTDVFVSRVDTNSNSTAQTYLSYFGGSADDAATSIFNSSNGFTYFAGETASANYPVSSNAFQSALKGSSDAFVTQLGSGAKLTFTAAGTPTPVGVGNQASFKFTIVNDAMATDVAHSITLADNLPQGAATFTSASSSPGTCSSTPANGQIGCLIGDLNPGQTATVTIVYTPVQSAPLTNTAQLSFPGSLSATCNGVINAANCLASATVQANDFSIASVAPATQSVVAGTDAHYTVTVNPFSCTAVGGTCSPGQFPDNISFACTNLPSGGACAFSTNPITNANNGAVATVLTLTTKRRTTTTVQLWHGANPFYAMWLPVSGMALLGAGLGRHRSRKSQALLGVFLAALFSLVLFQVACGGSSSSTTSNGTPAGTYTITVTATSGSTSHNTTFNLTVS